MPEQRCGGFTIKKNNAALKTTSLIRSISIGAAIFLIYILSLSSLSSSISSYPNEILVYALSEQTNNTVINNSNNQSSSFQY
jgi:hypothetical protein